MELKQELEAGVCGVCERIRGGGRDKGSTETGDSQDFKSARDTLSQGWGLRASTEALGLGGFN